MVECDEDVFKQHCAGKIRAVTLLGRRLRPRFGKHPDELNGNAPPLVPLSRTGIRVCSPRRFSSL
eukprot:4382472-Amphidinium_carterae.1